MGLNSIRRRAAPGDDAPRIYAVGDVHGRLDLLERLVELIRRDAADRPPRPTRVILLGDFIDRGPDSATLIRMFMQLDRERGFIVLKGNHEAAMTDALDGDHDALDMWLRHGGAATLASFGVDVTALGGDEGRLLRTARAAVPRAVRSWLRGLPTHVRFGRHYFVHAGVRPGVALDAQSDDDRLWIGEEFLRSDADHGAVIVHGHTIHEDGVHLGPNRIGVDTGAYRTGRLSAVGLEDARAWVLTATGRSDGARGSG